MNGRLPDGRVRCEFQGCDAHGCNQCETRWGTIYLCDAHKQRMQEDGDLE